MVDGLRDLLSDPEYSTRAAAAISLARVKADDLLTMSHIVRMLSDEDRLIREVGCLALGRLKSRLALKKLMYMWWVISCLYIFSVCVEELCVFSCEFGVVVVVVVELESRE